MRTRRVNFRPPGVKPWTRIGPLGPFRGRLGLAWVVAPLVVGAILVVFAWPLLFRPSAPGGSFRAVGPASTIPEGGARSTAIRGVFVGRVAGRVYAVRAEEGCSLSLCAVGYADCRGAVYGIDGQAAEGAGGLRVLPVALVRGVVYVDPDHPTGGSPAPPPAEPAPCRTG